MNGLEDIKQHYTPDSLLEKIISGITLSGKTPDSISLEEMAPLDEYHLRGAASTAELIELLIPELPPGAHVLDAGCGLGGPARRLAKKSDCLITGVDLSDSFCEAGSMINQWFKLEDRIKIQSGDVTNLVAFENETFDAAWTIHTAMNIAKKEQFYREINRVLKADSCFLIYDVIRLNNKKIAYPTPWAQNERSSFLASADEVQNYLISTGFNAIEQFDHTESTLSFLQTRVTKLRQTNELPPLGLHLILGNQFVTMFENLLENFSSGNLALIGFKCKKIST